MTAASPSVSRAPGLRRSVLLASLTAPLALFVAVEARPAASPSVAVDPVVDTFQRDELGIAWQVYNGNAGLSNGELGILDRSGPMLGLGIVAWQATSFGADQFSEAMIAPDKDPNALLQVFVRRRAWDSQRYGFHWNADFGGRWELKRDGGSPGVVLTTLAWPLGPGPGDILRIEVAGSSLRGLYNGNVVLSVVDSELTDAGQPGMALNIGRLTSLPASFVARWSGGSWRKEFAAGSG